MQAGGAMTVALVPLAASLALLVAGNVGVETDLQAATRGRRVTLEDTPSRSLAELEASPRLALFSDGSIGAVAAYRPRLRVAYELEGAADAAGGSAGSGDLEVVHRAEVLAWASLGRELRLRLQGEGGYGTTDLLSASLFTAQPIATTGRLRLVDAHVTAGLSAEPTRRTTLSVDVGALAVGGADSESRLVLPLQRAVLLDARLGWNATRVDVLSAVLAAMASRFEPISHAASARAGGTWQHGLSRSTALRSGLGAAFGWYDVPGTGTDAVRALTPWAEAAFLYTPSGPRPSADVGVRLDAAPDPVSRRIDQRLEAHAALSWEPRPSWTLSTQASGAAIRPTADGFDLGFREVQTKVAALEARATHRLSALTSISVGAFGRWQRTASEGVEPGAILPSFVEWGGLVEIGVGARWPERAPQLGPAPSRDVPSSETHESRRHGS